MTASSERITSFARQLMHAGRLLTWDFDEENDLVVLFIPPEADDARYPSSIDGTTVVLRKIPRPDALCRTSGSNRDSLL